MTMHDLIEKLKARPTTPAEQLVQQKREWQGALDQLFRSIEGWLAPALAAGVLKTSRVETEIVEQDLGSYQAPSLHITDGRATVRLDPVGANVVGIVTGGKRHTGLRGRVDLVCGPIKVPLARTQAGTWKALPLRGEPRDLNEETFVEILSEVLLDE